MQNLQIFQTVLSINIYSKKDNLRQKVSNLWKYFFFSANMKLSNRLLALIPPVILLVVVKTWIDNWHDLYIHKWRSLSNFIKLKICLKSWVSINYWILPKGKVGYKPISLYFLNICYTTRLDIFEYLIAVYIPFHWMIL